MGREDYRSIYGDLTKLEDDSLLKDPAAGSGDDDEMFQLLIAVSDWVDSYCNRHFYPRTRTLVFDGNNGWRAGPDAPAPILPLTAGNLDIARMEALIAFPAGIRQAFDEWDAQACYSLNCGRCQRWYH